MAIYRLAERGRRKSFGNKDISDELRKMPGLSPGEAESIIISAGFRRNDLENDGMLKRTTRLGKGTWALTPQGRERVSSTLSGQAPLAPLGDGFAKVVFDMLPDGEKRAVKHQATKILHEAGIDESAIWVLEQTKLTGAELERLLDRQGRNAITDREPAPRDNLEVEAQAIKFIIEKDERQWHRARKANQKGYDLEERNAEGNVVSWCEVKAINGPFALSQGVALSDAQFEMAFAQRDAYWLYIVENVGDPESTRVFAIRNPASQVKRLVFRDSWSFAATKVF